MLFAEAATVNVDWPALTAAALALGGSVGGGIATAAKLLLGYLQQKDAAHAAHVERVEARLNAQTDQSREHAALTTRALLEFQGASLKESAAMRETMIGVRRAVESVHDAVQALADRVESIEGRTPCHDPDPRRRKPQ